MAGGRSRTLKETNVKTDCIHLQSTLSQLDRSESQLYGPRRCTHIGRATMHVGCGSCSSRWMFVRGLTFVCALLSLRICAAAERCPPLTKKLLAPHAKMNTIMITAVDRVLYKRWIPSNWASAAKAGITYNFIAALDNQTSLGLKEELGIERCFTPDLSRLNYHLDAKHPIDGAHVDWGGQHWHETTWTKVLVVRMVFEMGFHVIHADSDITWIANPMQFFGKVRRRC
ncbi:FAD-binding FR-type domain-containing protein [Haematococcus lacustris]|uniref:FAD-binding FR-type domain-containing protein n=1 Tax=Haematococcus lacustris TaxID=44745 RepID=A0A699Z3Z9_HAELA|nr:FAD-binding FR-type domain-containing protein [Haematococcus lacustris]